MSITLSSRDFNQDSSSAKKATKQGPVFITERGKPSHVLLNIAEYRRITGTQPKIADLLIVPGTENIDLEFPKLTDVVRPAVF